jgi:hypothetical protein
LEKQPTTFDFANWVCVVKSNGVNEAGIEGKKFKWKKDYSEETAERRLENIVYPIAELADLKVVDPAGRATVNCTHVLKGVQLCYREFSRIWKFPYQKKHDHITVTIRDSWRNKHRNSTRDEWDKFISWAENRGEKVVVLEDREESPIPVKERWDLYQCKMNLFVPSGPAALPILSDAPYIIVGYPGNSHDVYLQTVHHWLWRNMQFPWANKNQKLVWKPDRFENIAGAFERIAASGVH